MSTYLINKLNNYDTELTNMIDNISGHLLNHLKEHKGEYK